MVVMKYDTYFQIDIENIKNCLFLKKKVMRSTTLLVICIALLAPFPLFSQNCRKTELNTRSFEFKVQAPHIETGWYPEWLQYTGGKKILPDSLPSQEKLAHKYFKSGFSGAMHEDTRSTDVSNFRGPLPEQAQARYFHVLEKGSDFSGMCPAFEFINDTTVVTMSFGRSTTSLVLLRVTDTIRLLDALEIPGRGNSVWELIGKKGRDKIFHNTAGGAYSYLSKRDYMYIPGANNTILKIKIGNERFIREDMTTFDITKQIAAGNYLDETIKGKEKLNVLTALMPSIYGNIWFTSRHGIVGLLRTSELDRDSCATIYATYIGLMAGIEKIKAHYQKDFTSEGDMEKYRNIEQLSPEGVEKFKEIFMSDPGTREEIQNSFSVGMDGIFIVTNYALYKLRFNEEKKVIELDPEWVDNYKEGELIYSNDHKVKPGQLNNGSGTTPTLVDTRFVAICDNDADRVNLCVFDRTTGDQIFKYKLFDEKGAAVENSVVAYANSLIVGNTYGYMDPFLQNPTAGGIMRFDYNEEKKTFERTPNWPAGTMYDCKSATPKLSTPNGLIYVYNRSDSAMNGHYDWQVTAIDYRTGLRVFYLKPYFNKGEFDDNISFLLKWGSLGSKNYDQKVFNNIWGTFTFGPGNSFYIGTYRGFLKVYSD